MKRCPQCNFIYFDIDETCDLDGTKLISVADAEVDAATQSSLADSSQTKASGAFLSGGRSLLLVAGGAVTIALAIFVLYNGTSKRSSSNSSSLQPPTDQSNQLVAKQAPTSPSPTPQPEAAPSVTPSEVAVIRSTEQVKTLPRAAVSSNPVSTTTDQKSKPGKVIIRLSNGSSIEADEAWRTREGIWYRRSGLVTLLKSNVVKSIERKH